jgi:DNA-binding protein HU-beta
MNHKDLVNHLADGAAVTKVGADVILKKLAEVIAAELVSQGQITLHGIGTISVADTAARKGRNPATGEEIDIPAGKRIKLKAAKALKDAVAG